MIQAEATSGAGEGGLWVGSAGLAIFAEALGRAARGAERALLSGPADPDGDSIAACLALAGALRALGCAEVVVAGVPGQRYAWMPGAEDMVPDAAVPADPARPFGLAVVLDGERARLHPQVRAAFDGAAQRALVDHHLSSQPDGYHLALVAPESASTAELVLRLIDAWGLPLDPAAAAQLYTGLLFDTGGFRHSNTRPETLRAAARLLEQGIDHNAICLRVLYERREPALRLLVRALGTARRVGRGGAIGWVRFSDFAELHVDYSDLEGVVDHLLHIEGVELAALFIERAPGQVRLSLRSRARVDVAALARALDPRGGGHRRAAGCLRAGPLQQVIAEVEPALCAALDRSAAPAP